MLDNIGARAIQSLGIDVANLTTRLSVNTATLDEIITMANEIDPQVWDAQTPLSDESGHPTGDYTVALHSVEALKIQSLLAFIGSLQ